MSFAVQQNNMWAAVLGLTFPSLLSALGPSGAFYLYAGTNLLGMSPSSPTPLVYETTDVDSLGHVFPPPTRDCVSFIPIHSTTADTVADNQSTNARGTRFRLRGPCASLHQVSNDDLATLVRKAIHILAKRRQATPTLSARRCRWRDAGKGSLGNSGWNERRVPRVFMDRSD
jgi:hypothetical protein